MPTYMCVLVSVYLLLLSGLDWATRRNPSWLTTPLIVILAVWRLGRGEWWLLPIWAALTGPYLAHVYGAADYRLLLVSFGLFPGWRFGLTLGAGMLILASLGLAWSRFRGGTRAPRRPARAALLAQGQPGIYLMALPCLAYVWLVAPLTEVMFV